MGAPVKKPPYIKASFFLFLELFRIRVLYPKEVCFKTACIVFAVSKLHPCVRGAGDACRRQGITLMPVVVESLGGWGEGAVRVVRRLAGALARHTGQEEKDVLRHQWGNLAISLQRGDSGE